MKLKDFFTAEFMRFLLSSGCAAAVNFGSRIALNLVMPYAPSLVGAYALGVITAFLLNRAYVFNAREGDARRQLAVFVAVNLLGLAQTLAVSLLLARVLFPAAGMTFFPEEIAHLCGIAAPTFTSFLGHKYFSFKRA